MMMVAGTIAALALIAFIRAVLMHKYASQIRGKNEKEELKNTLAFARKQPIVGWFLIGFWILQYSLVVALLVILVAGLG